MAVYVDDMYAPFGRMKMCHMIADSREELDTMADAIGVARKWIQYPGTYKEHYDVAMSARKKAVALGATEVTWSELGRMTTERRQTARCTECGSATCEGTHMSTTSAVVPPTWASPAPDTMGKFCEDLMNHDLTADFDPTLDPSDAKRTEPRR